MAGNQDVEETTNEDVFILVRMAAKAYQYTILGEGSELRTCTSWKVGSAIMAYLFQVLNHQSHIAHNCSVDGG